MSKQERNRTQTILTLLCGIVIPIVNYGILETVYRQVQGNIAYAAVSTVLQYVLTVTGGLIPFAIFSVVLYALCRDGIRGSGFALVCGYTGLLLPYVCEVLFLILFRSSYAVSLEEISAYSQTCMIRFAFDVLFLTVLVLVALGCRKYTKKRDSLEVADTLAVLSVAALRLAIEIHITAEFVFEVYYEYYDRLRLSDLWEIAQAYVEILILCAAGRFLMAAIDKLLDRKRNLPGQDMTAPVRATK